MADLATLEGQLKDAEGALDAYQNPNLPTEIEQATKKQWYPMLERSIGETQKLMSNFLPSYGAIPYTGLAAGTQASDLNPQQKIQMMNTGLGDLVGRLQQSTSISDFLGGKADEMADRALRAMQFGQQSAADKWSRLFNLYQLAFQASENEKNRRASGGGGTVINLGGEPSFGGGNQIQAVLEAAKGQGEAALYAALRDVETNPNNKYGSYAGGWDRLTPQQQNLLSPYWGEWQAQKYGEWARNLTWQQLQGALAGNAGPGY